MKNNLTEWQENPFNGEKVDILPDPIHFRMISL